eukprot:752990-Hanusia_phi.AAC.4
MAGRGMYPMGSGYAPPPHHHPPASYYGNVAPPPAQPIHRAPSQSAVRRCSETSMLSDLLAIRALPLSR